MLLFSLEGVLLLTTEKLEKGGKAKDTHGKEEKLAFDKHHVISQSGDLPASENLLATPSPVYVLCMDVSMILVSLQNSIRLTFWVLFQIFLPTSIYMLQTATVNCWVLFWTAQPLVSHEIRCFALAFRNLRCKDDSRE